MSKRGSNKGASPEDVGADRTRHATPGVSEHDDSIRVLDRMIAHLQWLSGKRNFPPGPTRDLNSPSLADELTDIHCTPMGVDTTLPPAGWEALARDWERVGSYMRSVIPCSSKQTQP